jgi:hypothetical protein
MKRKSILNDDETLTFFYDLFQKRNMKISILKFSSKSRFQYAHILKKKNIYARLFLCYYDYNEFARIYYFFLSFSLSILILINYS